MRILEGQKNLIKFCVITAIKILRTHRIKISSKTKKNIWKNQSIEEKRSTKMKNKRYLRAFLMRDDKGFEKWK